MLRLTSKFAIRNDWNIFLKYVTCIFGHDSDLAIAVKTAHLET